VLSDARIYIYVVQLIYWYAEILALEHKMDNCFCSVNRNSYPLRRLQKLLMTK